MEIEGKEIINNYKRQSWSGQRERKGVVERKTNKKKEKKNNERECKEDKE